MFHIFFIVFQQSAAFKILQTRLKTVPPHTFSGNKFKQTPAGARDSEISLDMSRGIQIEDGDGDHNAHDGINFASRLQQFEQMQRKHCMLSRSQSQSHSSNSTPYASSQVC